jgi:hypothetical protein
MAPEITDTRIFCTYTYNTSTRQPTLDWTLDHCINYIEMRLLLNYIARTYETINFQISSISFLERTTELYQVSFTYPEFAYIVSEQRLYEATH